MPPEKTGYGVGLAVNAKKRTKGWTPNPWAIQHLCKPIGQLSMTLVRLSGANSLRDPLISQLLGEWVASSPSAQARWSEAKDVGYHSLIRTKQMEAVKQYASSLFPALEFIGLLIDLNVTQTGFRHLSEFMPRRGLDYTADTGHTFPRPITKRQAFLYTWKDTPKPLELRPPVNVDDPPASGRS